MPVGGLLVGVGHPKNGCFVEGFARDLQADGQVLGSESAVYGEGRGIRQIEGRGKTAAPGETVDDLLFAANSGLLRYYRGRN